MKLKFTYRPRIKNSVAQKTLSRLLAFGVLINSISINSYAGMISEDGRYETFTGNNITVNDVLEEDKVDINIKGNTLVNLVNIEDKSNLSISGDDTLVKKSIKSEGKYRWEKQVSTGNAFYPKIYISKNDSNLIQSNKIYSIQYRISSSQLLDSNFQIENGDEILSLEIIYDEMNFDNETVGQYEVDNNNGILVKKVFRINSVENLKDISIIFSHVVEDGENVRYPQWVEISDLVLVEGDWSDKEIPDYFEGLKSVGELTENSVTIKCKNKNILPSNFINKSWVEPYRAKARISSEFILYKKNTLYTVYGLDESVYKDVFVEYSNERHELGTTDNINIIREHIVKYSKAKQITFTPNPNYKYMAIYTYSLDYPDNYVDIAEISVCEGDTPPLEYIKSESKDFNIDLKEPLRSTPNGVKDKLVKINGQWFVERNCGETILNGDENWSPLNLDYYDNKNIVYAHINKPNVSINKRDEITIISDKFQGLTYNSTYASKSNGIEGISSGNDYKLYLFIDKSKLLTEDVNGLKEWLRDNNIKVVYELENPIYEPIKSELSVNLFEGTTHISNNSNIPTNMEITIDRTLNRAIEAIKLAKINPTIENLSKARMWTNLLDDSIKKDELQSEINDIVDIEDLQLERKTVTSNIDVYIKSENMLLMSLSTNNITFEDYSGVEDIELNNAINISINSSLPYQLNSYLLTEIENSDKSNRIEKDLLNIKTNDDADYKTFNNINEKLILEDGCIAGNNKSHSIDFKLKGSQAHKADIYKTVIKFEAEQK